MRDSCYLGIDVGSGSVKAMLINSAGTPLAVASSGLKTSYPHHGHVEQDPDDWYSAACDAVRKAVKDAAFDSRQIGAIGLSGTSHVPSLLDSTYRPARPSIMFNDVRSSAQVERLAAEAGDLIIERTMNSVNCTWSLAQVAWVRENEPGVFSSVRHVLFSKDYLAYRLTGNLAADHSSAVSSLMVDVRSLDWDPELLQLAGLKREMVPSIHPSTAVIGGLTSEAARDLGLASGVPVAIGMLDSGAELIGVGAADPSVGVIRLGTAGGVMTIAGTPAWRPGCMLYPHPVRPFWYHQAGTNAATTSLQWVMALFQMQGAEAAYEELDRLIDEMPAGSGGLLFHPYLLGERAPYWSSHIRGGFSGATIHHGRAEFLKAVLEGVAYSLRDCTTLLAWDDIADIRLCGGGAKSRTWCSIIADVLGIPVVQMQLQDASALGAALVAVAAYEKRDLIQLAQTSVEDSSRIEPDMRNHAAYDKGFRQYRNIADQYARVFGSAP